MTSIKPFQMQDLFELNSVNLDPFTESFNVLFYLKYLFDWPDLFFKSVEEDASADLGSQISGYMMGKTEGSLSKMEWHTHITAVTINRNYRRINLASDLCTRLERISAAPPYDTLFVDLFVKVDNTTACNLYKKLGYSVYRRVLAYYGTSPPTSRTVLCDDMDAFDMRKSLRRDKKNETVRANGEKVCVFPGEVVF